MESPPLFETVEINNGNGNKLDDDLFISAQQVGSVIFQNMPVYQLILLGYLHPLWTIVNYK